MVEIIDRTSLNPENKRVRVSEMFRYATGGDKFWIFIAACCSFIHGAALPVMVVIFGHTTEFLMETDNLRNMIENEFSGFMNYYGNTWQKVFKDTSLLNPKGCWDFENYYVKEAKNATVNYTCADIPIEGRIRTIMLLRHCLPYAVVGGVVLVICTIHMNLWMRTAESQIYRVREALITSILSHDIAWFDKYSPSLLKEILSSDIGRVKEGILDCSSRLMRWSGTGFVSVGIALYYHPLLTAILCATGAVKVFALAILTSMVNWIKKIQKNNYGLSEKDARLALDDMRTVAAYGAQQFEIDTYKKDLKQTSKSTVEKSVFKGFAVGIVSLLTDGYYLIAAYYGGKFVQSDPDFNIATMIIVFFNIHLATIAFGGEIRGLQSLDGPRLSAYLVFSIIDETKENIYDKPKGLAPATFDGTVKFSNVSLKQKESYGSREMELQGVNFNVPSGRVVALVGSNTSGVSSIPEMLLRFKDPTSGKIQFDDKDLESYSLEWLRKNIGYVTTDPVMFSTSIANNVRYHKEKATDDEIIAALKEANVWELISDLPGGLNFVIGGEKNAKFPLTTSQRQRIRLATAIISKPKILILDKPTERMKDNTDTLLDEALTKAMKGRTVFIIPNTVEQAEAANVIFCFMHGELVEVGTPETLSKDGVYRRWVDKSKNVEMVQSKLFKSVAGTFASKWRAKTAEPTKSMAYKKSISAATQLLGKKSVVLKGIVKETKPFLKRRQYRQSVYSALRGETAEEGKKDNEETPYMRLLRLNSAEFQHIFVGCLASIVNGLHYIAIAYSFSQIFKMFSGSKEERQKVSDYMVMSFLIISIVNCVTMFTQFFCFGVAGEKLTHKIRVRTFEALMKQDIHWFSEHDSDKIINCLRVDSVTIQGLTNLRIGNNLLSCAMVMATIGYCMYNGPLLTMVVFANVPIIFLFGFLEVKTLAKVREMYAEAHNKASKVATESFRNARTITYLSARKSVVSLYMKQLQDSHATALKKSANVALVYGICQSICCFAYTSAFAFVGQVIELNMSTGSRAFAVFCFILFGAIGLGSIHGINLTESRFATQNLFSIIDSVPNIDYTEFKGQKIRGGYKADLEFDNVTFSYYNPNSLIIDQCAVTYPEGNRVCIVGHAAGATMDLLLRFYDPDKGIILLRDKPYPKYNIQWLRSQVGRVSGFPSFFDRTVAQNLAYGDTSRVVSREEMEWAVKATDIYNVIKDLQEGFDSNCHILTPTQRVRLDLSRVLIRNPKIFIADQVLANIEKPDDQQALLKTLLKVTQGRTFIYSPFNKDFLMCSDTVVVFEEGKIVAQGSPEDLREDSALYKKILHNCPSFENRPERRRYKSMVLSDYQLRPSSTEADKFDQDDMLTGGSINNLMSL